MIGVVDSSPQLDKWLKWLSWSDSQQPLQSMLYCVSKNMPTLASCSFDRHGLISINFSQQYQHTFKSGVPIQFPLTLQFFLFCGFVLLNSTDGNDAKCNMFYVVDLVGLQRAGCVGQWLQKTSFSLADVQSDVLLLPRMHITIFFVVQQLCR